MAKKKIIIIILALLTVAAGLGISATRLTRVSIDGELFPKNADVYDLTGHDLTEQQYLDLCTQYPDAEILWMVPFQGSKLPMDTQHIKISSLTKEDVDTLDYLHQLQYVEADDCRDYEALLCLQQRKPECQILYYVPLGSGSCDSLSASFTADNVSAAQLKEALPLLPKLERLGLTGSLPEIDELLDLRAAFPEVQLLCELNLWGQELHTDYRTLDFTGVSVNPQELSRMLPLFSCAEKVILSGTTLTVAQYQTLTSENPDILFQCDVEINGTVCSTDATELDISGTQITVEEAERLISFFPNLTKLVMSDCGIDDEAMDALNRKYPDIQIVWTVMVGLFSVRTDSIIFYPAGIDQFHLPNNEELQKLRYCTELVAVDIGHSAATDCSWLAYTPKVKYLIMADTDISDISPVANLKDLVYLEVFNTDITDYTPLLACTKLQDLNIGQTYGDIEPLRQMTWLHNLQWHPIQDHPVLGPQAKELIEQLPDTNITLKTRRKNIGGPWRYLPQYYVFREILNAGFFNQESIRDDRYWGYDDAKKLLACHNNAKLFAGDVMAEIVRYRIDNGIAIPGIKNIGSEKAEILYQSILEAQNLYHKENGVIQ